MSSSLVRIIQGSESDISAGGNPLTRVSLFQSWYYTPAIEADAFGAHLMFAFNYMRNQFLYFPWFMQDEAHRLSRDMLNPDVLHELTMELLKSRKTYHLAYGAAFAYSAQAKLAALGRPTLLLKRPGGAPALNAAAEAYADGRRIRTGLVGQGDRALADAIVAFLSELP